MRAIGTVVAVVLVASLAGCAAKTVKRDAYAEAASAKRSEIERLSKQIAELRASPDSGSFARRIDSLESVRAVAQSSLGGIGGAVQEAQKMQQEKRMFDGSAELKMDSAYNKKYPIKKP